MPQQAEMGQDSLRAALIKNASIHMAVNQTDGILRSYEAVVKSLPVWLDRLRDVDLSHRSQILPEVAKVTGMLEQDLPEGLEMMGDVVCRIYCAGNQPPDPRNRSEFLRMHSSPTQKAISATLLSEDWRTKRTVEKSIRSEGNQKRQILPHLQAHCRKYQDEIERNSIVFPELTPGELKFLTTRYSIVQFGLTTDFPVRDGALAHLKVKRIKYELQRAIYMRLLELDVASTVRFADDLEREVRRLFAPSPSRRNFGNQMSPVAMRWTQEQ